MTGKSEFPEILPPPPSSGCALLGPTDFSISLEKCPSSDSTSNCTCDIHSITSCSIGCITGKYTTDQWLYSSSSASSSVSGTHSDFLAFDDYTPVIVKQDCEDLYPLKEVMDGKEVITITTSNTAHTTSTPSVSTPASVSHFSLPYQGIQASRSQGEENCTRYTSKSYGHNQASSTSADTESCLLTPEAFLSDSPYSINSRHIPDQLSTSILSIKDSNIYEKDDINRQASAWASTRQECLKLTSKMPQVNCKVSDSKDYLDQLGVLKTSRKLTNFQDNENISESTSCGHEVDMISNTDDTEQDLKSIAQLDEDEQKEAERQSHQKISLYDIGRLPPIGVFWDIENCQVPKGLSATHVVQAIRTKFFSDHREVEFMCVCDTLKENPTILEELNDAQVNVIHVGSTVKNAADDKLLQSMRRFADIHGPGATIVLISGDSNFATELYDLRYRKNLRVILVHNAHAQDSLKLSAHETALFSEVTQELPQRAVKPKASFLRKDILVRNLPKGIEESAVRRRLNILSANCGGKVGRVSANCATISFQTPELATRAKKRLDGEDVYGSRIYCSFGKNIDKEGSRTEASGRWVHHYPHDKEADLSENSDTKDTLRFTSYPQAMGEVAEPGLSWKRRDSLGDSTSVQRPCSAFKSYGKSSSVALLYDEQQRSWQTSTHRMLGSPKIGGTSGCSSGLPRDFNLQNGEITEDKSVGSQPLYLDRTPDNLQKTQFHKPTFRMSSPPAFSYSSRNSDLYPFSSTYRGRNPSPITGTGGITTLKNTWNASGITDLHEHLLPGLQDISLGVSGSGMNVGSTQQVPVELQVANLDQNIDAREMKRILFTIFRDHVMILHISVFVQSDGNLVATVRVPSQQDAQYAISQLHRKKIGAKRIIISYVNHNQPSPEVKRSKVIMLLQEVPGKRLPLFKFRELYERRFHETIGVSEMYSMRDIVTVSDNSTGRMVALHPELRHIQSPELPEVMEETEGSFSRFCKLHSSEPDESVGWAERDSNTGLPNVNLTLRVLAASIHSLLQSHSGFLPLASLIDCYQSEIGSLEECEDGVPLEHLISCLPGICILTGAGGFKYIKWVENKVTDDADDLARSVSPPLVEQLALFSRELVDLFKTFPHCRLPFSRFIPAYHHHFGRQCRVADYGFTKLADLFDALPHIIQVLGEGNKRILTLAHKAQIKRFSSDLLRVLKGQPTKSITIENFPPAYEKIVNRQWNVVDYGVCDIEDLLTAVGETTVIVTRSGTEVTVAIPKREQTPEEIERTRQFAAEVIELLRHSPQCKMLFNRFIPAYHHHFGRQCRVADYGFSKLIELFEAIPDILQVFDDDDGEKHLQLVERERIRVLGEQVAVVVRGAPQQAIKMSALTQVFTHYYGYSLKPLQYGSGSLVDLIRKLRNHVKLAETEDEPLVALVDRGHLHEIMVRARRILWDIPDGSCTLDKFMATYEECYNAPPSLEIMKKDLEDIVIIDDEDTKIHLVPLQLFARDLLTLLHEAGGRMHLMNFDTAYLDRFGVACRPATYGFPNIVALVQSLGDLVTVRGRGVKRILVLNQDFAPAPPFLSIPANSSSTCEDSDTTVAANDSNTHESTSQLLLPHNITTSAQYEYQHLIPDTSTSTHLVMSVNPSPHHQPYQPSSPVVYPSSPAAPGSSMIWGQMWSPQYPVMPQLSPAHYMVPTIPVNWSSVPPSSVGAMNSGGTPAQLQTSPTPPPISVHTLDELSKQGNRVNEAFTSPPSASELPPPDLFTQMPPADFTFAGTVSHTERDQETLTREEGNADTWATGNPNEKTERTSTSTMPKLHTKRRLAAQFTST